MRHSVRKIISGGQTGVDRAALDAALELGIPVGGWIPKGRLEEDNGRIPEHYPNLVEADDAKPQVRTRLNVGSSDATLILTTGVVSEGTDYTRAVAQEINRPFILVTLDGSDAAITRAIDEVRGWLNSVRPTVLNVAGPRKKQDASVYGLAKRVLISALREHPPGTLEHVVPEAVLSRASDNMRHWDNIRWIVPFWYLSVAGASFTYLLQPQAQYVWLVAAAMLLVGLACISLVYRTLSYHKEQRKALLDNYLHENIGAREAESIMIRSTDSLIAMNFSGLEVLKRATTWFMVLMVAVCAFAALVLWYGDVQTVMLELDGLWSPSEAPDNVPETEVEGVSQP